MSDAKTILKGLAARRIMGRMVGAFLLNLVLGMALSALMAFPVKWIWNATVVELFHFPVIGVWMAWKISYLSSLLIKSVPSAGKSDD